jgi:hypothetical protein
MGIVLSRPTGQVAGVEMQSRYERYPDEGAAAATAPSPAQQVGAHFPRDEPSSSGVYKRVLDVATYLGGALLFAGIGAASMGGKAQSRAAGLARGIDQREQAGQGDVSGLQDRPAVTPEKAETDYVACLVAEVIQATTNPISGVLDPNEGLSEANKPRSANGRRLQQNKEPALGKGVSDKSPGEVDPQPFASAGGHSGPQGVARPADGESKPEQNGATQRIPGDASQFGGIGSGTGGGVVAPAPAPGAQGSGLPGKPDEPAKPKPSVNPKPTGEGGPCLQQYSAWQKAKRYQQLGQIHQQLGQARGDVQSHRRALVKDTTVAGGVGVGVGGGLLLAVAAAKLAQWIRSRARQSSTSIIPRNEIAPENL